MAYKFDGSTAYLELSSAIITTRPCWFACWASVTSTAAGRCAVSVGTSTGSNINGPQLGTAGTTWRAASVAAGTAVTADSPLAVATNLWTPIVGMFNSITDVSVYAGAVNRANVSTSNNPTGMDRTNIGKRQVGGGAGSPLFWLGNLAEVSIGLGFMSPSSVLAFARGGPITEVLPQQTILSYLPLRTDTGLKDFGVLSSSWTNNAALPVSDHPPVKVTPKRKIYFLNSVAATFKPAWAYGATRIIGGAFQ